MMSTRAKPSNHSSSLCPACLVTIANAPHYTMDLAKAAEAFKASTLNSAGWQIPVGHRFPHADALQPGQHHPPDHGRDPGSATWPQVNDKFVVEILGLPWPAYLAAQRA